MINGQVKINGFSINPKIGAYDWAGDNIGFIFGGELSVLSKKYISSIDYYHTAQVMNRESFNQIDLMFGKYFDKRNIRFQIQGGLGRLWGINETGYSTNYKKENISSFGIPLKAGFKLLASNFLSIGVDFQTHLNPNKSIYMTMISIEIGKLRKETNIP
jgi:hypothetical protein